jgi:hypothetical protein
MSADGDWIFSDGLIKNEELGNGKLDPWDKLLFMADDTGDRVTKEAWGSGYNKATEIEVIDPLTGEKGWCYLLYFASNPPTKSLEPDYVRYDHSTEILDTDCWKVQYIITKDGLHSTYYKNLWIKEDAGGNNKSFVDRLKVRIQAKLLFGAVPVRINEEGMKSNVIAYKSGPIRLNKRVEQYVHLPGGLKALRIVTDVMNYRSTITVPVRFDIPFKLDTVLTSFVFRVGTDYNENAYGAKIYNSCNPKGYLVNGKMDGEDTFDPGVDSWRLITDDFGTFMTRTIFTPEIWKKIKVSMGLIDDVSKAYPPEVYPGTIGYLWQDWNLTGLKRGAYYLFMEFYCIPNYRPGKEIQYVNYLDHPLKIRVGTQEGKSQALLIPELGKKY